MFDQYIPIQSAKGPLPFQHDPSLRMIVDTFIRKNTHHAVLLMSVSKLLQKYYLAALSHYLAQEDIPANFRHAKLLVIDFAAGKKNHAFDTDLQSLKSSLEHTKDYLVIALQISNMDFAENEHLFAELIAHPHCRFLIITYNTLTIDSEIFSTFTINQPAESDLQCILKLHRDELEHHHHVIIPDDLLTLSYHLVRRFLSTEATLEKTLLLLDSSAARAMMADTNTADINQPLQPVLTQMQLLEVLSAWTSIPAMQLQVNHFKATQFSEALQQRVFGQDIAINLIGQELQLAHANLQQKSGAFAALLFAGPADSGKKSMALALVDFLFKELTVFYIADHLQTARTLADIKLQRYTDKQYYSLSSVLQNTPHAVILFDQIEQASSRLLLQLEEVLTTGRINERDGQSLNFTQAILIFSTALGAGALSDIANRILAEKNNHKANFTELLMKDKLAADALTDLYSPDEIIDEISPAILTDFALAHHQQLKIIPFLPLDQSAIENIIRLKLKILCKQLDTRYGIQLGYAPEIVGYLANEVLSRQGKNHQFDTDKALKTLYFCVEQAILTQKDNKTRLNQLFLQLNETGKILRCDWTLLSTVRQHSH